MDTILIASGNSHKHAEIIRILASVGATGVTLVRPGELDRPAPPPDPVEDGATYLENAEIKARAFSAWADLPALADDSGLEVTALGGAPGLRSARYAGDDVDFAANIRKVLSRLGATGDDDRSGRFVCALALVDGDEPLFSTEGSCSGTVLEAPTGTDGFGYDPIFRPEGETRSFAEMSEEEKDRLSHRGRALRTFAAFIDGDAVTERPSAAGGASPR